MFSMGFRRISQEFQTEPKGDERGKEMDAGVAMAQVAKPLDTGDAKADARHMLTHLPKRADCEGCRLGKTKHKRLTAAAETYVKAPDRMTAHRQGVKANPGAARNQEAKEKFIRDYNFYAGRANLPLWDMGDVTS